MKITETIDKASLMFLTYEYPISFRVIST